MKHNRLFQLPTVLLGLLIAGSLSPARAGEKAASQQELSADVSAADSVQLARKHLSFGYTYLKEKRYEDAEKQLTLAWGYDPTHRKIAYHLGKLCDETERHEEAVRWFTQAIALAPEGKIAQGAYRYLTGIYTLQEKRPEAIRAYEALLGYANPPDREARYLNALVRLLVEEGDYPAALKHARRWSALAPDNPDIQKTIGELALRAGEEDEAVREMEAILKANPEDLNTLKKLAALYRKQGDAQKAFEAYQRLHTANPADFACLDHLYRLGRRLDKPADVQVNFLRKMWAIQPRNLAVIENLAELTGDIEVIEKGLALAPENGRFIYLKADHYYRRWAAASAAEDSTLALKWFEKAKPYPQWAPHAQAMIDHINPPPTEEDKRRAAFFRKDKTPEVANKGKK